MCARKRFNVLRRTLVGFLKVLNPRFSKEPREHLAGSTKNWSGDYIFYNKYMLCHSGEGLLVGFTTPKGTIRILLNMY